MPKQTTQTRRISRSTIEWEKIADKDLYTLQYYGNTSAIRRKARQVLLERHNIKK